MGQLLTMFFTIFIAELGDKTQVATVLFASERGNSPWKVFAASACALALGSAVSVVIGTLGGRWLHDLPLKLIAGVGFMAIGAWTVFDYYRGA